MRGVVECGCAAGAPLWYIGGTVRAVSVWIRSSGVSSCGSRAPSSRRHHPAEQGACPVFRIAEPGVEDIEYREAHVEADEVCQRQRTHRVVHPELHHRVNRLRRAHALHEREHGFVDHRHEDAICDEARVIGRFDRGLAQRATQGAGRLHGLGTRSLPADELDERHERDRVHEVHPQHQLGPPRSGSQHRDGDGRRVGREQTACRDDRIEPFEQRTLCRRVLDDRLHHAVDLCESVETRQEGEPACRRVAVLRRHRTLLDELRQAAIDCRACTVERGCRRIVEAHAVARLREHLGDTAAHRAAAHDPNRRDLTHDALQPSLPLDRQCDAVATAQAQGGDTTPGTTPRHRIQQRREDARAAGADGVSESHGAAVHVDASHIETELAGDRD